MAWGILIEPVPLWAVLSVMFLVGAGVFIYAECHHAPGECPDCGLLFMGRDRKRLRQRLADHASQFHPKLGGQ